MTFHGSERGYCSGCGMVLMKVDGLWICFYKLCRFTGVAQ
jgi:hypothetical protein